MLDFIRKFVMSENLPVYALPEGFEPPPVIALEDLVVIVLSELAPAADPIVQ